MTTTVAPHNTNFDAGKQCISRLPNAYPQNGMVWEMRGARKDCTPCVYPEQRTKAREEPQIVGLQTSKP